MTPSRSLALALLAAAFLALHAPYLPTTLEDLDSINFALGLHQFDVARHQPHPPGYPLYIAMGRAVRSRVDSDATALALVGVLAGSAGVLAIGALFRRLRPQDGVWWSAAATALAVTAPLYWMTAVRPLSDTVGLAAAVAVQALTLGAATRPRLMVAAVAAGLATGIRSQVFWLTAPLLFVTGLTPDKWRSHLSGVRPVTIAAALAVGIAVWFLPLVLLTGGPAAYWRAVFSQGAEDLSGIRMLWTTPTPRELLDAFYYAFVAPWAIWPLAAVVLAFAAAGLVRFARHDRRTLTLIAVAFGPYLVFDILFQETFTSRYALPLVVPVAFLAAAGMRAMPVQPAAAAAVLTAMAGAHLGGRSIAAYSRQPSPAFRLLADLRTASDQIGATPVLAPDRRESFDLRRPLLWLGDGAPTFARQLAAPPQHEWLEAVNYWNSGGQAPVWFVVDPRRAAMALVEHDSPTRYRWSLPYPVLMSGTRPGDADVYRVDRPDWYAGNGSALTPEAAGVSERDGADRRPLPVWVSADVQNGEIMVGGRNFDPSPHEVAVVAPTLGHQRLLQFAAAPGFFVRFAALPRFEPPIAERYLPLEIVRSDPARVAIEQFDAAGGVDPRPIVAFGDGFFEHEYDPGSGRQWRWLGARGELWYLARSGGRLEIEGESPRRYYTSGSRLTVRAGGTILKDVRLEDDFTIRVDVPPSGEPAAIVLDTDQTHVPAETSWRRSGDRRRLGLRIFRCELQPHP